MGRKQQKLLRKLKQDLQDKHSFPDADEDEGTGSIHFTNKQLSKRNKKLRKSKKCSVTISKTYPWYIVKVYDKTPPSKQFLEESFSTLMDSEFKMLGFHQSTNSARFFIENNSAAAESMKSLHKRMQGSSGMVMQITVQACNSFLILNAQQIIIVKEVLQRRYDASRSLLDLSNFHLDPVFLRENILPVMSDPAIFRQVMLTVKENIPGLRFLSLSNNSLRLTCVRVLAGSLANTCPLQAINLEANNLDNLKEILTVLSKFSLVELKLEGNNCVKDMNTRAGYVRAVQCKLPSIKTLDGQDISSFQAASSSSSQPKLDTSAQDQLNFSLNTSLASTSIAGAVSQKTAITEPLVEKFLDEYYTCFDQQNEQRLQIANAYTTDAKFAIDSSLPVIPSLMCQGTADIVKAFQSALPLTLHNKKTMSMKVLKLLNDLAELEISGELRVQGHDACVNFVHNLTLIPYNSGLGIAEGIMALK